MPRLFIALIALIIPVWLSAAESGMIFEQGIAAQFSHETITGLELDTSLRYVLPLSDSKDALWKDNRLEIGLLNAFTPAYNQTFLTLQLTPIAIFDFKIKAGPMPVYNLGLSWGYFPLSGPTTNNQFSNPVGQNKLLWWAQATPTLKIPLGFLYGGKMDQLVLMDSLDFIASINPGYSGYYVDWYSAYYLKGEFDWYMVNNTYLVFEAIENTLRVGLNMWILSMPNENNIEYRPSAVFIWTPKTDWARETFAAVLAGFDLTTRKGYFAFNVGANWKVF